MFILYASRVCCGVNVYEFHISTHVGNEGKGTMLCGRHLHCCLLSATTVDLVKKVQFSGIQNLGKKWTLQWEAFILSWELKLAI